MAPATLENLKCPMCQAEDLEVLDDILQCPGCNWSIWRAIAHRPMKDGELRALVEQGETKVLDGFRSKTGKTFAAILYLDDDGDVKFRFPPRAEFPQEPLGACPLCGGDVIEREKAYVCSNWRENQCKFTLWKDQSGHRLTRDEGAQLLAGETPGPFAMRSRQGKRFRAKLQLDREDGRVRYEFQETKPRHRRDEGDHASA